MEARRSPKALVTLALAALTLSGCVAQGSQAPTVSVICVFCGDIKTPEPPLDMTYPTE